MLTLSSKVGSFHPPESSLGCGPPHRMTALQGQEHGPFQGDVYNNN